MLWVALDEEDLEEDWLAIYREDFDHKHLYTICKETYYHFTYGNTREEIAEGRILLIEKNKDKNRTFSIELNKILLQEWNEYVTAVENWHRTGERNIGSYQGIPNYEPWKNCW